MRKLAFVLVSSAFLASAMLVQSPAEDEVPSGGCGSGAIKSLAASIDYVTPLYEAHKQTLQESDPAEWSRSAITEYLESCAMLVYYAMMWQLVADGNEPLSDPEELTTRGYLFKWPLNPFNNWEPMRIRDVDGQFYPGDIDREVCPPSYSTRGRQVSFELYVTGPTADWAEMPPRLLEKNEGWASPPDGAVFAIGYYIETDQEIEERQARWIERINAVLEQAAESAEEPAEESAEE